MLKYVIESLSTASHYICTVWPSIINRWMDAYMSVNMTIQVYHHVTDERVRELLWFMLFGIKLKFEILNATVKPFRL